MSTRKVSPRKATVLTSVVLAGTMLGGPALTAAYAATGPKSVRAAVVASTVVSRLTMATGPSAGANKLLISGTGLATAATVDTVTTYTAKAVKFGAVTVDPADVTALSTTALEVVVPAKTTAAKVTVLVGDATKGPTYTYVSPDLAVTTDQADLDALTPSSEFGQNGAVLAGTGFEATTKVLVGGLPTKATVTGTGITFALPAGRTGIQDVLVTDPRNSVYVGHVAYTALQPTLTAVSSYAVTEGTTPVTLTGTNLDAVTAVTFEGAPVEKVLFTKTTDPTKLVVSVPKGAAKTGTVKVATRYGKSATFALERKASAKPTVTAVDGAVAAGGTVTVTGTNLVGLKTVKATSAAGKVYAGVVSKVASETSATVKLPAMPAGSYNLVVNTLATAASDALSFTVGSSAPVGSAATVDATKKIVTVTGTNLARVTRMVLTPASGTAISRTTGIKYAADGTSATLTLTTALADGTYGVVATSAFGSSTSVALTVGEPAPEPVPAPTVTAATYTPSAADPVTPAFLTLTGTGLEVGTEVRYYVVGDEANAVEFTVTAPSGDDFVADLPGDLSTGEYQVEVRSAGATAWSTAATLTVS